MKDDTEFYRQRIAEADRAINDAILENVRGRALHARARWTELFQQHIRRLKERDRVNADKQARDTQRAGDLA